LESTNKSVIRKSILTFLKVEAQKRYQEVEGIYERLIDTTRRLMGSKNPNLALLLTRLAKLKSDGRDYLSATALHQEALEIRQSIFSAQHPLIATSMVNLAYTYQFLDRSEEAKELYVQALGIRIQVYGNSHQQVTFVKNALAGLDYALGKSKPALASRIQGEISAVRNSEEAAPNTIPSQSSEIANQGEIGAAPNLEEIADSHTIHSQPSVITAKIQELESQKVTLINQVASLDPQSLQVEIEQLQQNVQQKMDMITDLEQQKVALATQVNQLESQKKAVEVEVQQRQQQSKEAQINLLSIIEPFVNFTAAERTKLTVPLTQVLSDLEAQQQEYQQTWEQLKESIQHFNEYQEATDDIRFQLEMHYQINQTLAQLLPIDRQKVEQIVQSIREQLAELDQLLTQARTHHERAQQKSMIRF
jgi:tetratricopeptide (TPR) repeat protein